MTLSINDYNPINIVNIPCKKKECIKTKSDLISYLSFHEKKLEELDLLSMNIEANFDGRDIETIVNTCPNLKVFRMGHSNYLTNEAIVSLAKLKKLEVLHFENNFITDASPITQLVNLKHLKFHCPIKTLGSFEKLVNLESVSLLLVQKEMPSLDSLKRVPEMTIFGRSQMPSLEGFDYLKKLTLKLDTPISQLNLKNLEELTVICKKPYLPEIRGLPKLEQVKLNKKIYKICKRSIGG